MSSRNRLADVNLRPLGGRLYLRSHGSRTPQTMRPKLDFEAAMRELEDAGREAGTRRVPLEESLSAFERGVALTRNCQTALKEAEQKVEILLKKSGESAVQDFDSDEANPA